MSHATVLDPSRVRIVPIASLALDPANVRRRTAANLDAIRGSLMRFGQQKPIVVRDGVVRAGNGTLQVARELGWTEITIAETDLSDAELIAYGIVDNRSGELAEWDYPALTAALEGLQKLGTVPLAAAGFPDFKPLTINIAPLQSTAPIAGDGGGSSGGGGEAPRDTMSNQGNGSDHGSSVKDFLNSEIRVMQLPFPVAQFDKVSEAMGTMRERLAVTTNADVVRVLLERELQASLV